MSKRIGSLVLCLITALALAAFVAAPAFAHHKDGHDNGNGNRPAEGSASEEESAEASSDESSSGSTERQSSRKNREPSPDPSPSQAPQSTKGPSECPDYSQEEGGPYDHDNCDGSQGMHGSGGNGKCAGCTGRADDKSPGGQYPGDHNNGYECDNNSGVGKGNPAHSRCPVEPPTAVCVVDCVPPASVCPPGTDMAGQPPGPNGCDVEQRVDRVCPPGTDRAGEDMTNLEDCDDDSVLPNVITRRVAPVGPRPEGPRPQVQAGAVLPFTGAGGVTTFAALGFLLIALGSLGLRARTTT